MTLHVRARTKLERLYSQTVGLCRCRQQRLTRTHSEKASRVTKHVKEHMAIGFGSRRQWLHQTAAAIVGSGAICDPHREAGWSTVLGSPLQPTGHAITILTEFEPKSMLRVPETQVPRSKFPVIDVHSHLSFQATGQNGILLGEKMTYGAPPEEILPVMDRKNIQTMVDLTGGHGRGLAEVIQMWQTAYPGRFLVFTEPWWERSNEPGYSQFQADEIARAHQAGAKGLKVLKVLGLFLRENITTGKLVKVDDPRFDSMWEACGALGMPVAIHTADPDAFFLPTDRFNERFEELNHHPDWSFYDRDFPSCLELLEARNRIFARHPRTQFIALHVGRAEDLGYISHCLDRVPQHARGHRRADPNELGRQPRQAIKFFEKYQDRIMFGTDAGFAARLRKLPSRSLAMRCMKSITASWRPKTNTSTMPRRQFLPRDAGESPGWDCRTPSSTRSIIKTLRAC